MSKTGLPEKLIDKPAFLADNWKGYFHFQDPTTLPFNVLTYPSFNCTMPSFDKVVPDLGKTLLGQEYTDNLGIIGNKERFNNLGGIEMEGRVWASGDEDLGDVIQMGYLNDRLVFTGLTGTFQVGEIISGSTSGASGTITSVVGTVLRLQSIEGEFEVGEDIVGLISAATATTTLVPEYTFHQITENTNPLPPAPTGHEYYFDEWFDTDLDASISKNLPRLVWVNGYADTTDPADVNGEIYSWTGGIAVITSLTASDLTIDPDTTWRSLGFTEDANGDAFVVVNGVSYQLDDPADLDTNTIDVDDTTGVAIGDTATSRIEVDEAPIPFDMCRMNKNYMFYGNWRQRDLYMSNAFGRPSALNIIAVSALQNDLVLSGTYTGTEVKIFKVQIDSVAPDERTFEGTGLNDILWDVSGYTETDTNTYKVLFVSNLVLPYSGGSGTFSPGDIIVGGTSGSVAKVVFNNISSPGNGTLLLEGILGLFEPGGETITATGSGASATSGASTLQDGYQVYKNGDLQNISPWGDTNVLVDPPTTPVSITDGLEISFGNISGHNIGDFFELEYGINDTFFWSVDDVVQANNVVITGAVQTLSEGVEIQFVSTSGHTLGDYWTIEAVNEITRPWANFYYTLPIRRPGEGYKYRLPSNFWTMDTQEESMYVNDAYGGWGVVDTTLSADLQSETVSLTPLKQASANKVLYPYLTGHLNDKLVYINTSKDLNTIGREEFLEKPQTGYLSDPVKLDFIASSFRLGRIKYFDKRLYISSPNEGITHCYDTYKQYWQPPKMFPEVGILSIVGTDLVAHSHVRNQSFTMFTSTSGDNEQAYEVSMRTPYTPVGDRWQLKNSNQSFTEGYIRGNPKLIHTVYANINGCKGVFPHEIQPIVCITPDRAPFGEGSFGSHPNGSDVSIDADYFQEIYKGYAPSMEYYFVSIGVVCSAKSHTWEILATGLNGMDSNKGNNSLVNTTNLAKNNP